ncbi:RB1-inducible coiled-coil protein 1 isoform X1 [Anopheles gambiae]|uniref:RB1-inducible coiled-coil protein 1 isoform X1 n=1 Tax=Anopheles gambiae TaxID=7165 RepID=UPI002AC94D45|nr:RB1-inducible coiled-coil protein 1 isoform X1 [Anopheles gambiae]XP_061509428.1 RB1-inducible coiled-coil protein 1 isoform X1 [Anopheles gambiae]XP_061509429.1 RB1-inducible coiled-coil protein 1 isoform X1 [Anopheles gambiae]XP_061509430.1 RB1-inducible coiled-coil protein 1 isoform X1 [Anopheles gambiae]XP_061509431.1 RB1-inducible coiled-coil protein 1 isoform X1 [Anopheles gambiae]XP_061509432.1 RB1-inducible coiled-coil protein 1 isoform X1 [Anopheles gambiae]XP_061509433.1 RB1-indu
MMFVFHVDQGRMLTFKMECMFEDIRRLKELIERNHAIPARSIVLLVSGGELLEDESRACHYATGTDTNPIYMFCKTVGESPLLSPGPIKETEVDLDGLVRKSLELPVTFAGMAARAQLAQRIYEMGREELRRCESLIHEQHLQQQGWAAVVANMEDTIKEFQERCEYFNRYYEEQLRMYEEQMDILHSFDKSLQQLADIPILSSLMENAESRPYGVFDEVFNPSRAGSNTDQQSSSAAGGSAGGGGGGSGGVIVSTSAGGPPPGFEGNPDGDTVSEEGQKVEATGSGTELATVEDGGGEIALTEGERAKGISLLDWISAMEGQLTLKRMAEECRINIEKFNRNLLVNLNDRIEKAVKASQNVDIKVVKGLEERLRGLDELLAKAKKQLSDQNGLAEGIAKNQQSASKINDASVLPQLCVSHQNTLQLMKKNHADLLEYKRRCTVAKEELGLNLTKRIKYIMNVETRVHELDSTLQLYHTSLQRLQKHLSIIEQIHMVPCIYVSAVTEVVRRRMFSSAFLRWASDLACRLMAIHNEEVARRQDFTSIFEGHFLSSLFPGMTDMPPSYAIQAPSVFDSSLPALDKQDLEELSRYLPELTEKIPLPNIASVIDFFQTRSVEQQQLQQQDDGSGAGKDDASVRSKDGATSSSDNAAEQQSGGKESDKVGAESETDTEDYEKVQNQSPVGGRSTQEDAPVATVAVVETCSVATCTEPVETVCAETLTEDNLGTTRLEVERLKGLLSSVYQLSQDSIMMLRDQLARVRAEADSNRTQFQSELGAMNRAWNDIQQLARNRERETIQQLTVDHELEMNDLRKSIHHKDDEIQSLRSDNSTMKASHIETVSSYEQEKRELSDQIAQMREVIRRLEEQLASAEVDRRKAIQEAIEQLEHKHRTEMESLRCRFKLMATSMDRSPSDTSLEKIEKPDMIDIGTHEQLLAQVRLDLQREKEQAIKAAVEEERQRWETNAIGGGSSIVGSAGSAGNQRLHRSYGAAGSPGTGSQDVYKRILDEKDRQLEELREKEAQLMREVMRMRETIQSLTDPELSPLNDHSCREQMEALETDRQQLADRLDKLHDNLRTLEEEKNALACEVRKHRMDTAQLLTCSDGDTVTYVWNPKNSQYNIVQSGEFTYYLHESSYQALGLQPTVRGEQPDTLFGFGTVIHKEFCHARRDDNRYGVPQGACFYRVKLKPVNVSKKKKGRPSSSRGSGLSAEMAPAPQQPPTAIVTIEMQSSSSSRSGGGVGGGTLPITTSATAGQLIDSFAQTDHPTPSSTTTSSTTGGMADGSKSPTAASRDMIDSGVVEQQRSSYRERNISITDEEDGVVGSFGIGSTGSIDRIRYQSVCEEDDPADGDDDDDGDLADSAGGGGGSSATDHQQPSSCYASATDTTIVVTRTNQPPLIQASIAADSGNNSEASTASSTHPLATTSINNSTAITATNSTAQQPVAGQSLLSIADDVSDSADSEYRSLEANDQEDSDSAVAPLPLAGSAGRE